jgi:hypothetical protein
MRFRRMLVWGGSSAAVALARFVVLPVLTQFLFFIAVLAALGHLKIRDS